MIAGSVFFLSFFFFLYYNVKLQKATLCHRNCTTPPLQKIFSFVHFFRFRSALPIEAKTSYSFPFFCTFFSLLFLSFGSIFFLIHHYQTYCVSRDRRPLTIHIVGLSLIMTPKKVCSVSVFLFVYCSSFC